MVDGNIETQPAGGEECRGELGGADVASTLASVSCASDAFVDQEKQVVPL